MFDIYIINLEERKDRLEHIKKYFSEYNIIPVEAIKHIEGYKGCFLSHKKCIQIAKEKNLKYIIVLEDDCLPLENFSKRFENIISFLGPFHIQGKIENSTENLYKINGGYCMHFVIYNYTSYEYFLDQDISIPIDHTWKNNLQCLVPVPFIATQFDNFSNITNSIETKFSRRIRLNNKRLSKYINDTNIIYLA